MDANAIKKRSKEQKVLAFLKATKMNKPRFVINGGDITPGWVPLYVLQKGYIGGSAAYQRIVRLRNKYGIPIKHKRFELKNGLKLQTTIYSLDCNPLLVDIGNCCLKAHTPGPSQEGNLAFRQAQQPQTGDRSVRTPMEKPELEQRGARV